MSRVRPAGRWRRLPSPHPPGLCGLVAVLGLVVMAGAIPAGAEAGDERPRLFVPRTDGPIEIDGRLDEPAWREAPRVYLAQRRRPASAARLVGRVLWDREHLYVGFEVDDTDVRARMTGRDERLWEDGDVVEVFLYFGEPETDWLEVQVNPQGAFLDLRFPEGGPDPADPTLAEPMSWRWTGARWAVRVQGRLNDTSEPDEGWTAELALPWAGVPRDEAGEPMRPSRILLAAYDRDERWSGRRRRGRRLSYWPLLSREQFHRTHEYAALHLIPAHEPGQPREGFATVVHGQRSAEPVYELSYRGYAPRWEMTDKPDKPETEAGAARVAWRTAPAPSSAAAASADDEAVTFGFVGERRGGGDPQARAQTQRQAQTQAETEAEPAFELRVDGERVLHFGDGERTRWRGDEAVLERHLRGRGDYYTLTLGRDRLTPGEPVELEVRPRSADSEARWRLVPWTDAALMEHRHPGAWEVQRGLE